MMELRRIGVLSAAKVIGALYGLLGLIVGGIFSLVSLLGVGLGQAAGEGEAFVGLLFGVGAVIVLPIFYGLVGFVFTAVFVALFNLVTRMVGGIQLDLAQRP